MKLIEITHLPICIGDSHESILRSYHILQKVKDYLSEGVPPKVILEIIAELESS